MMTLSIKNNQDKLPIQNETVRKIARSILLEHGIAHYKICLAFLDNAQIQKLNRDFLDHDCPTDVLTFPYQSIHRNSKKPLWADIAISAEQAMYNSRIFNTCVAEELCLYIIHGILHAVGFNDTNPNEKQRMQREEQRLLSLYKKDTSGILKNGTFQN
jgi:probable rRNA maturation factor